MRNIKINLNLYKSFLEIYETKNYSVAATNLRLTQPTMSYNIRELEKQLKVRLFNTNSRGVEPTRNAEELYPIVRAAFAYLLTAEETILEFNEKSQGIVRINLSLNFMPQIASDLIAKFNKKYPNIKFEVVATNMENGNAALEKYESDLFIMARQKTERYDTSKFTVIDLLEVNTELFASENFLKIHGIEKTITKEQLMNLNMLSIPSDYQIRIELEKLGFFKKPIVETNSTQVLMGLAQNDMGIMFAPSNFAQKSGLVRVEVKDLTMPKYNISVKYNNNLANKAGTAFISMIRNNT